MKKIICLVLILLLTLAIPVTANNELEITLQPQNYNYPEYSVAMYVVKANGTNLQCTWYLEYEGKTYNLSDNTNAMEPWEGYAGENYGGSQPDSNTFVWFFGGIEAGLDGAQIWCVIEDGHNDVTSDRAIITVQGDAMPPEILNVPAAVTAYRGDEMEIRCIATSNSDAQLEFQWYETSTGRLQDIMALPEESSDFLFCSTEAVGTRYYVCCVTTTTGGRAYSNVIPVTVLDADPEYHPEMEILTEKLPDATVGQPYQAELKCNDPYGIFAPYYNPGHPNQLEDSGLYMTMENMIMGTPLKAGTVTFCVCASGEYGEDYMEYTLTVKEAVETPDLTAPDETVQPAESEDVTAPDATDVPDASQPGTGETIGVADDISVQQKNESAEGFPWWAVVLIGIAAAGAGIGVAIILLKKKK